MYQVSILVPVYKVEKYIERCARSLFEQTYENLEYIFVDNCSPDKSIEILERVMEDYPTRKEHVHIIQHEKNRGLSASRNTLLDNAHGLFVSFVDSDDYLERDAIQLFVNKQVETDADIVSGNHYIITNKGIKKSDKPTYTNKYEMMLWTLDPFLFSRVLWGRLIKTSLFNNHHIRAKEGLNYWDDWQLFPPVVYYANQIAKIDDYVYYFNSTNNHSVMTESNRKPRIETWKQIMISSNIIDSFFVDKEPEYIEASRRFAIIKLKQILHLSATFRVKDVFNEVKTIILSQYVLPGCNWLG